MSETILDRLSKYDDLFKRAQQQAAFVGIETGSDVAVSDPHLLYALIADAKAAAEAQSSEIDRLRSLLKDREAEIDELLEAFDALERAWRGRPVRNLDERFVAVARIAKTRALSNKDSLSSQSKPSPSLSDKE